MAEGNEVPSVSMTANWRNTAIDFAWKAVLGDNIHGSVEAKNKLIHRDMENLVRGVAEVAVRQYQDLMHNHNNKKG